MIDNPKVLETLQKKGWCRITKFYDSEFVRIAKEKIKALKPEYDRLQKKGGVLESAQNTMHHICVYEPDLVDKIFNNKLWDLLIDHFDGKFILNSFGVTILEPNGQTYTQKMHRDARDIHSSKDMLNLIILLDKSTPENGATKLLEGSHEKSFRPNEEDFIKNAIDIPGDEGDLIIFTPYVWHASGTNSTNNSRTIITPMVTRPFIKSGLDYVRALGPNYFKNCPDKLKQLFGYNARTAANLSQFYAPKEKRMYKSDQV